MVITHHNSDNCLFYATYYVWTRLIVDWQEFELMSSAKDQVSASIDCQEVQFCHVGYDLSALVLTFQSLENLAHMIIHAQSFRT